MPSSTNHDHGLRFKSPNRDIDLLSALVFSAAIDDDTETSSLSLRPEPQQRLLDWMALNPQLVAHLGAGHSRCPSREFDDEMGLAVQPAKAPGSHAQVHGHHLPGSANEIHV